MKLYGYFRSSASYRVRIALGLKNLKSEMAYIDLIKGEHKSAEYAKVNAQGVVPSFVDHNHTLIQSIAILEYLEETYPNPPLLPKDPFARAHVRALAQVIAADTSPLGNLKVRKKLEAEGMEKDTIDGWVRHWIADGLAAFEKLVATSPYTGKYCCGDMPGLADCCLIPQLYNADRFGVPLDAYPRIQKIAKACEAHPAFTAAHPSKQADAA